MDSRLSFYDVTANVVKIALKFLSADNLPKNRTFVLGCNRSIFSTDSEHKFSAATTTAPL